VRDGSNRPELSGRDDKPMLNPRNIARSIYPIHLGNARTMIFLVAVMLCGTYSQKSAKASIATNPNPTAGKSLYIKYGCYECHGLQGQGSPATGPRLANPGLFPLAAFIAYVRKPTGEMPPYTNKVLRDEELSDIHAFLSSLPVSPKPDDIPLLRDIRGRR
jgi:ubiquinol-cytochrome c reductase cytochrome c subunit